MEDKPLKVPTSLELPKPEDRKFENFFVEAPIRKLKSVDIKFGDLSEKNVEQFRILNYVNLPVVYSEDFYRRLTSYTRYSKLAYLKDVLVGAISCKEDTQEDGSKAVYIMTITVLKPYRRFGIGSNLLEKAIEDCAKAKNVGKMTLHVQKGNESAM
jgi:N-alpha-acetyltransferase 50